MTAEIRFILFDQAEVAKAVLTHWKARGRALPRGTVKEMRSEKHGADQWAFNIELQPDGGLASERHQCVGDDLRDALINAAKTQSIPLPARAYKRVECIDQQLCLAMRMGGRQR